MLRVTIPGSEQYLESSNEFITTKDTVLVLEHSLVSISKWEAKWKRSYMNHGPKTFEEHVDYIRCMTITQNVDPNVYYAIPVDVMHRIYEYMADPMTATVINSNVLQTEGKAKDIVTSELIYYWMFSNGIPMECQKWHINKLMTLLRVFAIHSETPKKIPVSETRARNRSLNAARRARYHTKG